MSSRLLWVAALLPLFGCDPITAPQLSRTTIVISVTPTGTFTTGTGAWISDDGRRVSFISDATNIVADQSLPDLHVYVKNRGNGTVELATRNSDAGNAPVACSPTGSTFMSANGRFCVYLATASADNGTGPLSAGISNVFVRDLESNVTKRAINKSVWPNSSILYPSISEDGRYVVFATVASNLGMGSPPFQQIYVSDLSTSPPTLTLVSHANGVAGTACNSACSDCWISADGHTIAYRSSATNLDLADGDGFTDIFVASSISGSVSDSIVVSRNPAGVKADGNNNFPHLSADGNFVVFVTSAPNMGVGLENVMVRNLQTNQTTCVTITADGLGPNSGCLEPRVSRGGTRVAFVSAASNLTGIAPGSNQPFITVPDGGFEQVSVSDDGDRAAFQGTKISMSSEGVWVVWSSTSGNLVVPDPNGAEDVFARGPFRR